MNIFKKIILNAYIPLLVLAGLSCSGTSDGGTISVQSVTIDDKSTLTVTMGKTLQLSATVLPDDASNKEVTWSSGDTNVATVDGSGLVSPVRVDGSVTITVTSKADATKSDTIQISTTPRSEAGITSLEVTIGTTDYTVSVDGTIGTVVIPSSDDIPTSLTVKEVTLSPGATGLVKDGTIDLTDGSANVVITAEDGTTKATFTIKVAKNFSVSEVPKTNPTRDRRHHYVLFEISSGGGGDLGRHKLALKLKTEIAPTATEMTDGAGVYRVINSTVKKILLAYPLSSNIKVYTSNNGGNAKLHGAAIPDSTDTVDIDSLLLAPNSEYTLYALNIGKNSVEKLVDLSTDNFNPNEAPLAGVSNYANDPAISGDTYYDDEDAAFIVPWIVSIDDIGSNVLEYTYLNEVPAVRVNYNKNKQSGVYLNTYPVALFPSQYTDGTQKYYTAISKGITAFYVSMKIENLRNNDTVIIEVNSNNKQLISQTTIKEQ